MNDEAAAAKGYRYVGKPVKRGEAYEKVTGKWGYGTDKVVPGMLHAKVLRSPYPHARILSIDVGEARRLHGVRAVVTGENLPYLFGSGVRDEPFLARGKVRYVGEPVAAVAAVSEAVAREAIDLIEVEYEELPGVFDPLEAMKPESPVLHEDLGSYDIEKSVTAYPGTNILSHTKIRRGDVDKAFTEADEVFEDVFTTQLVHTCPMEPHGAIAQVTGDGAVTIWASNQSPYNSLRDLAKALDIPFSKVRVICEGVGGGFGAKNYLRVEPLAVAIAMHTNGAPVRLMLTRDEEFTATTAKHPTHITIKTGVMRDGTLVARKIAAIYDTGGYADSGALVSRNGSLSGNGPYRIPNVWIDSYSVYTNNPLGGSFRGFGLPQYTWAHESQMDMIAHRMGLDPVEFRMKNLYELGDSTPTGEILTTSVGVKETLARAAEAARYSSAPIETGNPGTVRALGVATMQKLTNTPSTSTAIVKMHQDGSVNLLCSSRELGQGINTAIRQIVAEALGIDIDLIRISPPDTDYTPYDQSTSGSRSVFHMGNAMISAVRDLTGKLCKMAAEQLDCDADEMFYKDGMVWKRDTNISKTPREIIEGHFGARGSTVQGDGYYAPRDYEPLDKETGQSAKASAFWMYATQIADVEVDLETGTTRVRKIWAAHDAGTIINPEGARGQIEGALAQGIGTALMEEMVVDHGTVINPSFSEYRIPTALDVPESETIFVETYNENGPFGAKGIGEPALAATPSAIANAVYNATGARITSLPITPEKVLKALKEAKNDRA
ncbi:MAG: xanthine dehydrogenase family protein molybdopterin-binding subunit [Roseovarius sp.]|nr:xanthine dehydrogenase family protein molybdopterin-binding subunit [Roseovarius sp.]